MLYGLGAAASDVYAFETFVLLYSSPTFSLSLVLVLIPHCTNGGVRT